MTAPTIAARSPNTQRVRKAAVFVSGDSGSVTR
jgi:hypothetical protein